MLTSKEKKRGRANRPNETVIGTLSPASTSPFFFFFFFSFF